MPCIKCLRLTQEAEAALDELLRSPADDPRHAAHADDDGDRSHHALVPSADREEDSFEELLDSDAEPIRDRRNNPPSTDDPVVPRCLEDDPSLVTKDSFRNWQCIQYSRCYVGNK